MRAVLSLLRLLGHSDPYVVARLNAPGLDNGHAYAHSFPELDRHGNPTGNLDRDKLRAALRGPNRSRPVHRDNGWLGPARGRGVRSGRRSASQTLT